MVIRDIFHDKHRDWISVKAMPAVNLSGASGGIFLFDSKANLLVLFSSCLADISIIITN